MLNKGKSNIANSAILAQVDELETAVSKTCASDSFSRELIPTDFSATGEELKDSSSESELLNEIEAMTVSNKEDDVETSFKDGENEVDEHEESLDDNQTEAVSNFYAYADDVESSEKVNLLLESVTKKMCNISHNMSDDKGDANDSDNVENDEDADNDADDESGTQDMKRTVLNKGKKYREGRRASPSAGRLFLQGRQMSGEEAMDQPKNVEC